MIRKPIVAGTFYPEDPNKLLEIIKKSFLNYEFGPGKLPENKESNVKAVIVPHAGYIYSGFCAAHAYKLIAETNADTFILFGTDHTLQGTGLTLLDWQTPLGIVKTDKEIAEELINNGIKENDYAHIQEHSIEVQLPFLQFIKKNFKIVAITIGDEKIKANAFSILRALEKFKDRRIIFIASSDFTHYGITYGYVPFVDNVKEKIYKLDNDAIEYIKKLDANGFLDYCKKTGTTICGKNAIALLTEIMKDKARKVELLKYYTSADIVGNYELAVGYASIAFF